MTQFSTQRVHSLDALRGGALLLGVFFHTAFSFFPGDVFWVVKDTQESAGIAVLAFTLHMFRMAVFFLLAGYFGRMLCERLSSAHFIRDRLKRIAIPIVIFWPICMVCMVGVAIWAMIVSNGGSMPENPPPTPPLTLKTFPLMHLWFLYLLIIFYLGMLVMRKIMSFVDSTHRLARLSDTFFARIGWTPFVPIVLALPLTYSFLVLPVWHPFFGIPTPEYGFVPNQTALIAYGSAFTLGYLLQRKPNLLNTATRLWWVYLIAAVALTAYCLLQIGTTIEFVPVLDSQTKSAYALSYALGLWCWVFGLIGLCLKFWSNESPVRRYLADASYWIYLIHIPIVMALQVYVSQWSIPAELKFCLILSVALSIMLLSYHTVVRYSFIGRLLNGRKHTKIATRTREVNS